MSNKKYRKYAVTTMAAAAAVASVAPVVTAADETKDFTDVNENHNFYNEIMDLASEGVITGFEDGTFRPQAPIRRVQVANMIQRELNLDVPEDLEAALVDYVDVKEGDEYDKVIAAVSEAGILTGNQNDQFNAWKDITREQMASVLYRAYDLGQYDADHVDVNLKGVDDSHKEAVQKLADLGITTGTALDDFQPIKPITRGQFAAQMHRTLTYVNAQITIDSVKAENASTLTLTGTGLNNLTADDLSLKDNEVDKLEVAKDSKSATVTFKHNFPDGEKQTLVVKQNDKMKEYTFTYNFAGVESVELDERTYDDDTPGQLLTFKVNGQTTTTDSDFLRQQGYDVNFVAVNSDGEPADIFKGNTNTSKTGLLADTVAIDEYKVEIQLTKSGKVVYSDKATITVADLESSTQSINELEFENGAGFVMNSTTLVTTETATLTDIIANAAGKKDVHLIASTATVESSNPAVVSVNNQTLTANSPGTAKITVTVGGVSRTVDFTVSNADRVVSKAEPSESKVKIVEGQIRDIQITTTDQYGDPVSVSETNGDVEADAPKNDAEEDLVKTTKLETTLDNGQVEANKGDVNTGYTIEGSKVGSGTLLIKDKNKNVIGQVAVEVTDKVDTPVTSKVENTVASDTQSNTITTNQINEYLVAEYTKTGFYNGNKGLVDNGTPDEGELLVESSDVETAKVAVNNDKFTVTPLKAGSVDIHITDENGQTVHKFTVTINASSAVITKVNFEDVSEVITAAGETIDVSTFLDVRPAQADKNDGVVYGIEHNVDTAAKVRLETTDAQNPFLYIDQNDDGTYNDGTADGEEKEIVLGTLQAEVLTGAEGLSIGTIADITPGNGVETELGDKGVVLIRVMDADSKDEKDTIATSYITINVEK